MNHLKNSECNPEYLICKFFTYKSILWVFMAFGILFFSNSVVAANDSSECIAKYKAKLLKGGWTYGFFCEHGSTFVKTNINSDKYIIYNYVYKFIPPDGSVMHGGQRLVFFNLNYDYLGQFFIDVPPYIKILQSDDGDKLILSDGKQAVGYIILSSPPESTLYGESLNFFR